MAEIPPKDFKAVSAASKPRRRGFTLIELLSVIVLISILMTAAGLSVRKAKLLAQNTKAEAECRELVNALLEYRSLYGDWPGGEKARGEVEASYEILEPLINSSANASGIVFLNLPLVKGEKWRDPWRRPYSIYFPDGRNTNPRRTALETCVSFPFRRLARE